MNTIESHLSNKELQNFSKTMAIPLLTRTWGCIPVSEWVKQKPLL